jgi:drug/metabolite transporter (DMT)-like permease
MSTRSNAASGLPVAGILLLLAALTILPVMDGCAKLLSRDLPVYEVSWARYVVHWVLLAPLLLARYGRQAFRPTKMGMQLARSTALLVSTVLFFFGLAYMPQANTLALFFVSPLIATALAPFVLGEKVGPRRVIAVAVGFVGALIIIRPGIGVFRWPALFGLSAGLGYAFYALATRRLAGSAPPLVTAGFTALVGAVVLSLTAPLYWVAPSLVDIGLMLAIGGIAALGHYLVILSYERAAASLLAPFGYYEIIGAVVVGYVLFGDFPDRWTWLGIAVLAASGIYISLRERRLGRQRSTVPDSAP